MSGYNLISQVDRLRKLAQDLGFELRPCRWGDGNLVALVPADQAWPLYSRNTDLFTGTLDQVEAWMRGIQSSRNYDQMLKISTDKKRQRAEQDWRNTVLSKILADQPPEEPKS